jgi:hypothetical protein
MIGTYRDVEADMGVAFTKTMATQRLHLRLADAMERLR